MANIKQIMDEAKAYATANPGQNPFDAIRKQKIDALKTLTGRPVLIYAADFLNPKLPPNLSQLISITLNDKDPIADAIENIPGEAVDLLVHSPGGSAEATEGIVDQLRAKFNDIRVLVPGTAKSAATLLAMAGNSLVLDQLSELGPTDPQMFINGRYSPAGAILKQFEKAQEELKNDPSSIGAWLPVLQLYGPSILVECQNHLDLSRRLVQTWLAQYMFAGEANAVTKASEVAEWLANDEHHLSHSRRVGIDDLIGKNVKVVDMRTDVALREAVRQLHLAVMGTFQNTGSFKIYENSEGFILAHGVAVQTVTPTVASAPAA